ncbi:MAG: hypothetical protein U9Q08_02460 [Candidatus Omnitrophota bacterium]|nr:hypothetical protein [Candidatus Omnitrophota bacterium]
MWLFLIILFMLGFLHTTINLSLLGKKRYVIGFNAALAAVSFFLFPFAARLNIQMLDRFVGNFNRLSSICAYQIIESILIMLLSLLLIKDHYAGRQKMSSRFLSLLPSGIFLAGVFFLQTYLFNVIEKFQFYFIALILSLTLFGVLILSALGIRRLFPKWEWRIELKIILSFLQILLSMFLPLIIIGMKIGHTQLQVDVKAAVITLAAMLIVVSAGYYKSNYRSA